MDRNQQLLANMHTFSISAKLMSFTKAAEELCISQGAVSQRIKTLETQLGFKLFVRLTRKLELTAEGERLLHTFNRSFDKIFSEIQDIQFNELRGELYIGLAPTFARTWLLSKLPTFQQRYPNLNLKLRVKGSRLDFNHEAVDTAIYYGDERYSNVFHRRLYEEYLSPVCSPNYYTKLFGTTNHQSVNWVEKLSEATFIHSTESLEYGEPHAEWRTWLTKQSNPQLSQMNVLKSSCVINSSDMTMLAANSGMGIAMARVSLVEPYFESGGLIAPFEAVKSGLSYDLICPIGQETRPKIKAFIDWLEEEVLRLDQFQRWHDDLIFN
jgi:LysR family transcriptional regulator, D-serine deaminase activator